MRVVSPLFVLGIVAFLTGAIHWASFASPAAYAAAPDAQPPPVRPLKDNPSDDEIGEARLFPQRIMPVNPAPPSGLSRLLAGITRQKPTVSRNENSNVAVALRKVQNALDAHDISALQEFANANPQSRWTPALRFEIARRQFAAGFFAEAIAGWDALWDELKDSRDFGSVQVADEVLAQLLEANIGLGKAPRLERLVGEQESRPGNGVLDGKPMCKQQNLRVFPTGHQVNYSIWSTIRTIFLI